MRRFTNQTNHSVISDAIFKAEQLLDGNSELMKLVRVKNDFRYNSGKGLEVCVKLLSEKPLVNVFTYKPFNIFTKAIGYSDGKAIYINARKIGSMELKDIVANLCHEYAHYSGFSHGNNYKSEEKCLYSVPYFLSEWVTNQ